MKSENPAVAALREALKVSPNNLPLREHLARTLLSAGHAADAEREFRDALKLAPDHARLKSGLARAFARQGKHSEAMAVLETLIPAPNCPAEAHLLYARLLLHSRKPDQARRHYQKAVEADASLADPELARRLNPVPDPEPSMEQDVPLPRAVPTVERPDEPTTLDSDVERPTVRFRDVGGMESVKEEIRMKIIHPLAHPELYSAYGKKVGGGILMYGPPGCGKTHMARATAGEIRARFMAIGINDVLDMWIGSSERNLHELFDQARRNKPCVLFFDEVDALAASRADMRHHGGRHLINQFLSEMDGIAADNEGLLILAATNAPWHVDSAFRRPGRFDRVLFVPPPDAAARAAILRILVQGKPVDDIDFDHVAKKTDGFSGADLKGVIDIAVEAKLRQAMKAGSGILPLTGRDLLAAAGSVNASTREWFAAAKNYALYSNQGGVYDDVVKYLKLR